MGAGHQKEAIGWKRRRFARSHVGKDHSGALFDRIGLLTNRFAKTFATVHFSRHVDDLAVYVVEPPVIDAAQPAVFEPAVAQVRAAVRAVQIEQPELSLFIAKQHELFAEEFYGKGRRADGYFFRECRRLPVAAHQLAARSSRSGFCE